MIAPPRVNPSDPRGLIVLFDLRRPGAGDRLRRVREGWPPGFAEVEWLDAGRAALVLRPGGALRLGS
jgi:hypothetical protein